MPLPLSYSIRNAFARKLTGILTVAGITLVVFVFCAVLMLAQGLEKTLVDTGSDKNVKVVRQSANTEVVSILPRANADIIKADPAVLRNPDGTPKFATELLAMIAMTKKSDNTIVNVNVRGGMQASIDIRPTFRLVQGRMFNPSSSEAIVGVKVARNYGGATEGDRLFFGSRYWTIVGIFETGGTSCESEIWVDVDQLGASFNWPTFSSFTFEMTPGTDYVALKNRLEADRRLVVEVMPEREYYRRQSESFTIFIRGIGTFIAIIFALGAVIGAMITMYAAVANRTTEIGTLRALGFSRLSVLSAFLVEALIISFLGGVMGIGLATFLRYLEITTTNFDSFSELVFSFKMSSDIAIQAMTFSIVMGLLGGFLPSVRASRLRIVQALKAR